MIKGKEVRVAVSFQGAKKSRRYWENDTGGYVMKHGLKAPRMGVCVVLLLSLLLPSTGSGKTETAGQFIFVQGKVSVIRGTGLWHMLQLTPYLRANAGISVSLAETRDGDIDKTTDSTPNNVILARIMKTP